MNHVPGYGKILALGSQMTENALVGDVIIQEKVDGSQFRFGFNESGKIVCSSKSVAIDIENPPQLFREGVEYIQMALSGIQAQCQVSGIEIYKDVYFYGEYLQTPKHNTLAYDRIPTNHICLFDVLDEGKWLDRLEVAIWAGLLSVDVIPELYSGPATIDTIMGLLQTKSYLGGQTLEGVVVKNYGQTIEYAGRLQTLFCKYVREEFKELHHQNQDYIPNKEKTAALFSEYRIETRWDKAIQHIRDAGELENSPRDIGKIIAEVPADILSENEAEIKDRLWSLYKKDFTKIVTRGLPEHYKKKLLDNLH